MADSFEFDFHPVGDGGRSGEAISGQFTIDGVSKVIVIDGGTMDSGEEVSEKIQKYYGTNVIDYMVLTHADDDHSSGLRAIMDNCEVKELWMNRPWLYAGEILDKFKGNWTEAGLAKKLKENFPIVAELEEKADAEGIPIYDPLTGAQFGPFTVVSPNRDFYLDLLPQMSRTPDAAEDTVVEGVIAKVVGIAAAAKAVVFGAFETWSIETLNDSGETSASNESSVILYGTVDDKSLFFTGDSGQKALENAADFCDAVGFTLQKFRLVSVPHHGSRRNVGPTILNRVIGERVAEGTLNGTSAIVSASKNDTDHPRRVVTNAFKRRGVRVVTTEGNCVRSQHNAGDRAGFSAAEEEPLHSVVEE